MKPDSVLVWCSKKAHGGAWFVQLGNSHQKKQVDAVYITATTKSRDKVTENLRGVGPQVARWFFECERAELRIIEGEKGSVALVLDRRVPEEPSCEECSGRLLNITAHSDSETVYLCTGCGKEWRVEPESHLEA